MSVGGMAARSEVAGPACSSSPGFRVKPGMGGPALANAIDIVAMTVAQVTDVEIRHGDGGLLHIAPHSAIESAPARGGCTSNPWRFRRRSRQSMSRPQSSLCTGQGTRTPQARPPCCRVAQIGSQVTSRTLKTPFFALSLSSAKSAASLMSVLATTLPHSRHSLMALTVLVFGQFPFFH